MEDQDTELFDKDTEEREINITAAICLLRGRAFEALENRAQALRWYQAALKADPYCFEAFERLIENHMLTSDEETNLLSSLKFEPEDRWLFLLYSCHLKKYDQLSTMESKFATMESKFAELERDPYESGSDGDAVGCSLKDNADLVACKSDHYYHRGEYQKCYETTKALLEKDPYHLKCIPMHLASAVELGRKNELFLKAHMLVQEYPQRALAWFAVGCYYLCIRQFDHARRYFCKATTLDGAFACAWIGFGHAYAAQDESDQAMAAYRTAARLFAGCHLPVLCIGMEYLRTNNLNLAQQFFMNARRICPTDPLIFNEMGVMAYRNKDYEAAVRNFRKTLRLIPLPLTEAWEATVVNLAHSLRKLMFYTEAITFYEKALALSSRSAGTYAALGFTHHLQGNTTLAIEYYHKALGLKPDDTFTVEMLNTALADECTRMSDRMPAEAWASNSYLS
ncbi:hypothetical protein KP509_29G072200 [Ceratopteris richardii]|nr:hypothetical protein KP509_29G072200 [Ceratopteris richardii]